jgi:hypothetical protein
VRYPSSSYDGDSANDSTPEESAGLESSDEIFGDDEGFAVEKASKLSMPEKASEQSFETTRNDYDVEEDAVGVCVDVGIARDFSRGDHADA